MIWIKALKCCLIGMVLGGTEKFATVALDYLVLA